MPEEKQYHTLIKEALARKGKSTGWLARTAGTSHRGIRLNRGGFPPLIAKIAEVLDIDRRTLIHANARMGYGLNLYGMHGRALNVLMDLVVEYQMVQAENDTIQELSEQQVADLMVQVGLRHNGRLPAHYKEEVTMGMAERMEEKDRAEHSGGPAAYDREQRIQHNRETGSRGHIGGGYVGYHGSVDEQPDNPQHPCDDD